MGGPFPQCCGRQRRESPGKGERIPRRHGLLPKAIIQPLVWEAANLGTFPWQRVFCVPPLKPSLLGAEPGSLSLGWGFHLPQLPWAEK